MGKEYDACGGGTGINNGGGGMRDAVVACKLMTSFTSPRRRRRGGDSDIASGAMVVARKDANDRTTGGVHPPDAEGDGNDKCGSMVTSDNDGSVHRATTMTYRRWP